MPKPTRTSFLKRTLAVLALVAVLPLPLAGYATAEESVDEEAFAESFDDFAALPAMPQAQGNMVDITEFTPPVEIEEAVPEPSDIRSIAGGIASYYGKRFHGRRTANGERFDMNELTAAHKTLPFGTRVLVTNPRNGKSVTVRINDRGPYAHGRTIDLSRAAAKQVGIVQRGHGKVELALLK